MAPPLPHGLARCPTGGGEAVHAISAPLSRVARSAAREKILSAVTSKGLCQHERGADALVAVFVVEDGEQDTVHRGSVGEDSHRPGSPADLSEAAFDGVGGSALL